MNVKPIAFIRIPVEIIDSQGEIRNQLAKQLVDYHVLVASTHNVEDIQLEVFYEKDMTHVKFDELKEIVSNLKTEAV